MPRPFRLPGNGDWPLLACSGLITFWVLLGSWTAVFPGTIDSALGLDYSFKDEWGVSEGRFLLFTLGTLGLIVVIAVAGYAAGAKVRRDMVPVSLGTADRVVATPA